MATVNEKMTAIADAIRAKTGGTEPLGLDAMAQAIANIGGLPGEIEALTSGTIESTTGYRYLNIEHNLGVVPNLMFVIMKNSEDASYSASAKPILAYVQIRVDRDVGDLMRYHYLYKSSSSGTISINNGNDSTAYLTDVEANLYGLDTSYSFPVDMPYVWVCAKLKGVV